MSGNELSRSDIPLQGSKVSGKRHCTIRDHETIERKAAGLRFVRKTIVYFYLFRRDFGEINLQFRETGYAIAAEHLVRTRGQRSRPRGFWLEVERVDSPVRTALAPSAYRAQSTRDVDARAHGSSYTVAIDLESVILVTYHSSFALLLCDLSISKSVYRFHCFEQLYFTPTISTIVVAKFRNFVKERKEGRVFDGKIKSSIADWFTFGRRVSPTSKFARAIYWQFFKSN